MHYRLLLVCLLPLPVLAADPATQLAKARVASEAKDFPLAEKILTTVIAENPSSSEAYIARGFLWLGQKKTDIERGLTGAKLALGDLAQLKRRGIDYPQMAELTLFLEKLTSP
jgi:hypothetical protein